MSPEYIKMTVISILGLSFIFNLVISMLSSGNTSKPLPEEVKDVYDEDKYEASIRYILTNANFSIISGSIGLISTVLFIFFDGFAILDSYIEQSGVYPELKGVWYFGILFFASDIFNLPMQLYVQFGIEERFGFNKMTYGLFFKDKLKSYLISALLGGAVLFLLFWLLNVLKEDYWYVFWGVISIIILALNLLYTSVFVPLFNKLTPLEEGELKDAILDYSEEVDFPIENIFVIDGSKRSTKSNAYFSGFGKQKKIVLYDTLIQELTPDEIVAVLAHEAGHYKKKHIVKGLIFSVLQVGAILFISSLFLFSKDLSLAFGVKHLALHINLIVFSMLFAPISSVVGVIMNIFSRKNEYEADAYAKQTHNEDALISSLKKLSKTNYSNLMPHWIDVFLNYSHPTLIQRIKALKK